MPSSSIAQVESSGTAGVVGSGGLVIGGGGSIIGGGGSSMGVASIAGLERSRVTLPVAPRRTPGTLPKNTSPKETPPALKPAHVPDWGAANHNASVSPAPLDALIIPTDGLTDRDTLWLKTGRPWILILMDFVVSSAKLLLKSKLTVPVNEARGPEMLPKLPDRWNVSTMSAFAPEAANTASPATALVDASRLAHEGSDLCPPASAPNCVIGPPTHPPEGTALRPLCAYTINHPPTTTKHHATKFFCDIDHNSRAHHASSAPLTRSRREFFGTVSERRPDTQAGCGVAGLFLWPL